MQIFYYMTSILDIKQKKPLFHDEYTRHQKHRKDVKNIKHRENE